MKRSFRFKIDWVLSAKTTSKPANSLTIFKFVFNYLAWENAMINEKPWRENVTSKTLAIYGMLCVEDLYFNKLCFF